MIDKIPIEFIPGLWVSDPGGVRGRGSGFLLAENIKSVISVDTSIPKTSGRWTVLEVTHQELTKESYLDALIRIITESWLETNSVIIIGTYPCIQKILVRFLQKTSGLSEDNAYNVISTKIDSF